MPGRGKKVKPQFKTATEDLFDRGRKARERGRIGRRSGWESKYVHMKPRCSHVTSHYLLIRSAAGCCLPVMTSILQISSCSQAQFVWPLDAQSSGSVSPNRPKTSFITDTAWHRPGHQVPFVLTGILKSR